MDLSQNQGKKWEFVEGEIPSKWITKVDPKNPLPQYPRPQLRRDEWLNLNGLWDYTITSRKENRVTKYDGKILVPFAIESALSGVKKKLKPSQKLWYRRFFDFPETWKGRDVLLHFGAVDWLAEVWLNNNKLGVHIGGYTPFSFEISKYLHDERNELVVSVWDPTNKGNQERGKQTLNPFLAFYTAISGIWQTVWIEPVSKTRINNFRITPDIDKKEVSFQIKGENILPNDRIHIQIKEKRKTISSTSFKISDNIKIKIPNPKLWSVESPFLYDVSMHIKRGRTRFDVIKTYFGMRKISLKKDRKKIVRLALNNKIMFQYGTLDQGYWPDGLYTAPTDDALKYDVEITKELGFNMIRKHVKVEPSRWYYHCDKIGMLVWQDMPNGGSIIAGAAGMIFGGKYHFKFGRYKKVNRSNFYNELNSMISTLYNHPSVITWVPFNEAWGQFETEKVTNFVSKLDSSRLIDSVSGWVDKKVGDIRDIHRYPGPAIPDLEEERAAVLGEFGGLGYKTKEHIWSSRILWAYRKYNSVDELSARYSNLIDELKELKNQGLASAIYTQITDVEGEINGLLTYDRERIKMDSSFLKKLHKSLYSARQSKKKTEK